MTKGDKIIWDSGFGYEVGFFIEDADKLHYDTYRIDLVTGVAQGDSTRPKREVLPHSPEKVAKMEAKYNYRREF